MERPKGITILGILHLIIGILFATATVAMLIGIPMMIDQVSAALFGLGMLLISGVLAVLSFTIAFALFSGKKWSRIVIIISSIIGSALNTISIVTGDLSSVFGLALDLVILWYMWRPHVIAYFEAH